jgi:hypothetical protein
MMLEMKRKGLNAELQDYDYTTVGVVEESLHNIFRQIDFEIKNFPRPK